MAAPMVALRASGALESELSSRGDSMNAVALRDLRRYYTSIEDTLCEFHLSEDEWRFLRDILNGTLLDERTAQYLWSEVEDADPETAEKWHVNQSDLVGRIRYAPAFTRLAIVDSVERWWRAH